MPSTLSNNPDNQNDSDKRPTWDTSDNQLALWLLNLKRWLPRQNTAYSTLIKHGTALDKRHIICVSVNHVDRHRLKLIQPGTFEAPFIVLENTYEDEGIDEEAEGYQDALDAALDKHYAISPELIDRAQQEMCDRILDCIDDDDTIDELRAMCEHHGSKLLELLELDCPS